MDALKKTILAGENQHTAFFENADNSNELAKTLVAFINSDGGIVLLGLKKNGKIIGVNPEDELQKLTEIVNSSCEPAVIFSSRVIQEGFNRIVEILVEESEFKPHKLISSLKKEAYIRIGNQNRSANKILESVWKYAKQNGTSPAEFSQNEQLILNLVKENPKISLTQIYKKTELTIKTVDYILVCLICWNLLDMDLTETGSLFSVLE